MWVGVAMDVDDAVGLEVGEAAGIGVLAVGVAVGTGVGTGMADISTAVGTERSVPIVPSPSRPFALDPQQYAVPPVARPHV